MHALLMTKSSGRYIGRRAGPGHLTSPAAWGSTDISSSSRSLLTANGPSIYLEIAVWMIKQLVTGASLAHISHGFSFENCPIFRYDTRLGLLTQAGLGFHALPMEHDKPAGPDSLASALLHVHILQYPDARR